MRKQGKTDDNQAEIVEGLRKLGYTVWITSGMGGGGPDIVAGKYGCNWLFEIKDPSKVPSKRALTPAESLWHLTWKGQIHKVETVEEILTITSEYHAAVAEI